MVARLAVNQLVGVRIPVPEQFLSEEHFMTFELFTIISTGLAGTWLILVAFWMKTENFRSTFLFKFLPFTSGLSCWIVCAKTWGLI